MKKLFLVVFSLLFFLPLQVRAVESGWTAADFVTEGETLYGFSKSGVDKLASNGHLVLPSQDSEGRPLTRIASFAFVYNKKTAISDYTAREDENGQTSLQDVDGHEIQALGEEFNAAQLLSVSIPEGYREIGSDAFSDNSRLSSVSLPESLLSISDYAFAHGALSQLTLPNQLQKIGHQAFFDNQIAGDLALPQALISLGERAFKSNRLTGLTFRGQQLEVLSEYSFQDNQLSRVLIPLSIREIQEGVFADNAGPEAYAGLVVLTTPDGSNPHHLTEQGFYLNPKEMGAPTEKSDTSAANASWNEADFRFDGARILGFSEAGERKVKTNKELILPASNDGLAITEIAADAFRNIDFAQSSLRKYDLEKVIFPASLKKIGDFAFQSNNLTELELPEGLEEIGAGAFMNNKIDSLLLNDQLKTIGAAAFHINRISAIVLPENLESLGFSAFRQNGAQNLIILSSKLRYLPATSFAQNNLEEVDLTLASALESIDVQAFAGNRLKQLLFPAGLKSIGSEAFKTNQLKTVTLPDSLTSLTFNAFDDNPGQADDEGKVVVETSATGLADGSHFIVNPKQLATDRTSLQEMVKRLVAVNLSQLQDETQSHYKAMVKQGQDLLNQKQLRQGQLLAYLHDTGFFLSRRELDQAIKLARDTQAAYKKSLDQPLLEEKVAEAQKAYNNLAVSTERIAEIQTELALLSDLVAGKGAMGKAKMAQGVYHLTGIAPLLDYYIGVQVYVDQSGKILYVADRSRVIGQGQKNQYGAPIVNVDEDNEAYHQLALASLKDYRGLNLDQVLGSDLNQLPMIAAVEQAPDHRRGFFLAIQDAARDLKENLKKSDQYQKSGEGKINNLQPGPKEELIQEGDLPKVVEEAAFLPLPKTGQKVRILPKTGMESGFIYLFLASLLLFLIVGLYRHRSL